MAMQADTKSFPRAVPDRTLTMRLCCTAVTIACCSLSSVTPKASRMNVFQSALHVANRPSALRSPLLLLPPCVLLLAVLLCACAHEQLGKREVG